MKWLGIHFPKWLKIDLSYSEDILGASIDTCVRTFKELLNFSLKKGIPIGVYDVRCRTIDQNGIAQPMPRPFRKSGRNTIQRYSLTIQA